MDRTYPHHECMRRVHKICHVSLGSTLEAQLAVGGHWIVHENDVIGQLAVVQNFTMILAQLATFRLEPKLILGDKNGIYMYTVQMVKSLERLERNMA